MKLFACRKYLVELKLFWFVDPKAKQDVTIAIILQKVFRTR
jgi:hypothetical protein